MRKLFILHTYLECIDQNIFKFTKFINEDLDNSIIKNILAFMMVFLIIIFFTIGILIILYCMLKMIDIFNDFVIKWNYEK